MQIIALFYIIHRITLALTLTGVAMVLCSCQTSQRKTFDRIQVGMDKSTVVEALGSPTATRRQKGKDRWIYEFRDGPQEPATREVDFNEGRAVYVGPKHVPPISAEEQDRLNEVANAEEQRHLEEEAESRDRVLGTARVLKKGRRQEDAMDRRMRESLYGVSSTEDEEKRKQPLIFEPVR